VSNPPAGGTTIPAGASTVEEGETVTAMATAKAGYTFSGWTAMPAMPVGANPASPSISFEMTGDLTLTANFTETAPPTPPTPPAGTTYTLALSSTAGGSTAPVPGTTTHASGATVIVTATPYTGYAFSGWTGTGAPADPTVNPAAVIMTGDLTLVANFTATNQHINTLWYSENPTALTFTISTAAELAGLAEIVNTTTAGSSYATEQFENKTITLAADIDLSVYNAAAVTFNDGKGWVPIGKNANNARFLGKFDGNGKTVSGLYINNTVLDFAGLFGDAGVAANHAEIVDLDVVNVNITARDYVGAIAGRIFGAIDDCGSTGTVKGRNQIGGVAGRIEDGSARASFSASTVAGELNIGGLAGIVGDGGQMKNCYATGNVNGTSGRVGGLVGTNEGNINNCYATGSVNDGTESVGGVVGHNITTHKIISCYSLGTVSSNNRVGGVVGTYSNSADVISCAGLNAKVSSIGTNVGRVVGAGGIGPQSAIAFDGMLNSANTTEWGTKTATSINGEDISVEEIIADPTMGNRFTADNGWTIVPGKLPGLLGAAVDIPAYMSAAAQ
jgi:uncharacterized repeat protein (TIGR02543 family)